MQSNAQQLIIDRAASVNPLIICAGTAWPFMPICMTLARGDTRVNVADKVGMSRLPGTVGSGTPNSTAAQVVFSLFWLTSFPKVPKNADSKEINAGFSLSCSNGGVSCA
jgi:hypothetical protein